MEQVRSWARRAQSIFARQLASYLFIILVSAGITSFLFFSTARRQFENEIGARLQDIAQIAARNAPFERLALIRKGDDNARMVLRLKQKLAEIQEATGVRDIYVFDLQMNALVDLAPEVLIGARYEAPQFLPAFVSSLQSGHATHTAGYVKGDAQPFISAYAPIFDEAERLFAVAGVDAGTEELSIIEQMRSRFYWITLAIFGFALVLALFFARSITSPIRHLAQTAERLGSGDYDARVEVAAHGELGLLSHSINRMAEQVRKRDAALKEMSATVAHEIRNPLNSIKLLVSLIDEELEGQGNRTQASTVETLHYEIGKLSRFIDEFLTYARPLTLIRDGVSPGNLVAEALEMAAADARENGVQIGCELAGDLPDMVVDRLRMEQVLLNLLLNAIQACGPGDRVAIRVQSQGAGQGVDFVVEDTGPGIPAEVLPNIFEPFFTTKEEGTGLGLANAFRIVAEHGGTLSAENRPERGARFTVHLPRERLKA